MLSVCNLLGCPDILGCHRSLLIFYNDYFICATFGHVTGRALFFGIAHSLMATQANLVAIHTFNPVSIFLVITQPAEAAVLPCILFQLHLPGNMAVKTLQFLVRALEDFFIN